MKSFFERAKVGEVASFVIRGGSGVMGLKVGYMVLSLATTVILARTLGVAEFGTYSLALALATLFAIPTKLGIPSLMVREVARYSESRSYSLLHGLLLRANQFVVGSTVAIGVVAVMLWLYWPETLGGVRGETTVYLLALFAIPLMAFNAIRAAALRGLHRVVTGQLPEMTIQPAVFIAALVLTASSLRLEAAGAMALQVLSLGAAFIVGTIWLLRALPPEVQRSEPNYETRTWIASIAPLSLLAGMQVVNSQAGTVLLGYMQSGKEVAAFRVAVQISSLVAFALLATNAAVAPRMAKLYLKGDISQLQKLVSVVAWMSSIIALPMVGVLCYFGEDIISLTFGGDFVRSYAPMVVLCLGQLISTFAGSVVTLLNMTNNENVAASGMLVAALVNVALSALLISDWGAVGAALANCASLIIWNVTLYWQCYSRVGVDTGVIPVASLIGRIRNAG